MNYILEGREKGCFFCRGGTKREGKNNLVLHKTKYSFAVMNKFPYNNGHLMVVPKRHCPELDQLDDKETRDLFSLLRTSISVLRVTLHAEGFNIGINMGKAAGAGVDDHVHIHVVPRWAGDTNFMPVLGETKIVPEYLERTYQKLRSAFKGVLRGRKGQEGGEKK
jgi:ATP adenylyltransferase